MDKAPLSSDKLNSTKQTISFLPKEAVKTKNNVQINSNNTSEKNDSKVTTNSIISKKQNSDNEIGCQSKRPRISINSDDEDEESTKSNRSITIEIANNKPQTTKQLPKNNKQKSKSQVIVVERQESKVRFLIYMYTLR